MSKKQCLILAPTWMEAQLFLKSLTLIPVKRQTWQRQSSVSYLNFFENEFVCFVLVVTGMGKDNASKILEAALALFDQVSDVLLVGFAGGLAPHSQKGDLVFPRVIGDLDTGDTFEHLSFSPSALQNRPKTWSRLATSSYVIGDPIEKAAVYSSTGFEVVDMEASPLARLCKKKDLKFVVIRAVLDGGHDALPDFGDSINPFGQVRISKMISMLVRDQKMIQEMWSLRPSMMLPVAKVFTEEVERYVSQDLGYSLSSQFKK
ncbi:MAG: hypothetical protein R3A11_05145 [Bdellovibrionota bacterium]